MSYEQLFTHSALNVVVPDTSVSFPPDGDVDDWLLKLKSGDVDRKHAFFDEQLRSFLTIHVDHPNPDSPPDPEHPPDVLLSLLLHTQITLEASYISLQPPEEPAAQSAPLLSAPPRSSSLAKKSSQNSAHLQVNSHQRHPSILLPETPNPTPQSAENDRKYATSEGTLLITKAWGQDLSDDSADSFTLLWSKMEQTWVAVYILSITISFVRLTFQNPLLCLTISATLREKPNLMTNPNHPFAVYLSSIGRSQILASTETPEKIPANKPEQVPHEHLARLEEANIFEGLCSGPTFRDVYFPTTRLGTVSRQKLYSLPPIVFPRESSPDPSPKSAVQDNHPTLRKSFRKTLPTVSGFLVRMRTVFVPRVLFPFDLDRDRDKSTGEAGDEINEVRDAEDREREREEREAGAEERSVVLCVEIQNSGESTGGFIIERVRVHVGGEGTNARLIGWGDNFYQARDSSDNEREESMFPLHLGPMAQCNLLYAVSFLHAPADDRYFKQQQQRNRDPASELQRAVTINVLGKPYYTDPKLVFVTPNLNDFEERKISYPTRSFSSKWNCVIDLSTSAQAPRPLLRPLEGDSGNQHHQALPEPPSPFPSVSWTPNVLSSGAATPISGGNPATKRHTIPVVSPSSAGVGGRSPGRAFSINNPVRKPGGGFMGSTYFPPSVTTKSGLGRSPTTCGAPPPIPPTSYYTGLPPGPVMSSPPSDSVGYRSQSVSGSLGELTPQTPANPAWSISIEGSTSQNVGTLGPAVNVRRERGIGPTTPGPWVGGVGARGRRAGDSTEGSEEADVVVSVGMLAVSDLDIGQPVLSLPSLPGADDDKTPKAQDAPEEGEEEVKKEDAKKDTKQKNKGAGSRRRSSDKIYPWEYFTIDIFVYNKSDRVRRFEVSCPDMDPSSWRNRSKPASGRGEGSNLKSLMESPGILPMDARVRVGPLSPSGCQSVRMRFLALMPGIHAIETLTLTDIETGFVMNLKSVMDVVVHDP